MIGLAFISILFLVATLGYLIVPDSTPFANDQILSIAAKPPLRFNHWNTSPAI